MAKRGCSTAGGASGAAKGAAIGAAVGLNRELSLKPAGLRTHALVSLGAALATLVGLYLTQAATGDTTAPSRIVQGIVAGIGFTVALFIAGLAFPGHPELLDEAKLGILAGSLAAGVVGALVLRATAPVR